MACCRLSARFIPPFKKAATPSAACDNRILSSPLEKAGSAIVAIAPAMPTTISNSMSVTPRWLRRYFWLLTF